MNKTDVHVTNQIPLLYTPGRNPSWNPLGSKLSFEPCNGRTPSRKTIELHRRCESSQVDSLSAAHERDHNLATSRSDLAFGLKVRLDADILGAYRSHGLPGLSIVAAGGYRQL